MPTIASTDFRGTDITEYIPINMLAAGTVIPLTTAGAYRVFQTTAPCKILALKVITGSTAVGTVTFTAGYDVRAMDGTVLPTTVLNTTLGAASATAVASSTVSCPIDVATTDNLPPTIPAGAYVGFNHSSSGTAAGGVCGVLLTFRYL
jgi:hypothetical protein